MGYNLAKQKNDSSVKLNEGDKEIVVRHDQPFGASGSDISGKIQNTDDHIVALQGFEASILYDKMRRSETQIKKVLAAINNPIKSAEWSIQSASDDAIDLERAALIEQILFKDLNWPKFLNEALTAVPHGFALFEMVHANKITQELGPYTGLAQLGFRKQTTITQWCYDSVTGCLENVKQESNGDIKVNADIPAEFLLQVYIEPEGDNAGFPLLRALYGPYKRKLLIMELKMIGIERFAIGTPMLKSPKGIKSEDEEYKAAVEVLQGFTSAEDAFIIFPDGWDLELTQSSFDPGKLQSSIKYEDEQMAGAILASFLELGTGGNSGANSLSKDQSDFFLDGIEMYANTIRDVINRVLIPQLIKLNFGEDTQESAPELAYNGITDKAGETLMKIITGYSAAGIVHADEGLEDHVRKVHKLPPKIEGEMIENQESEGDGNNSADDNTEQSENGDDNITDSDGDSDSENKQFKLADNVGHSHKGTGPAIARGQKHYHDLLDANGNAEGRTKTEKNEPGHIHIISEDKNTGKPIETKAKVEAKENPATLIATEEIILVDIIRKNLKNISDKYINDVLNNYKNLSDKDKLKAPRGVKIGGVASFRKELRAELTNAARKSMNMVQSEVPAAVDVKLSSDMGSIRAEFKNADNFKFNDFSKLPKRIQILIANTAGQISDKEAGDIADTVAFQFTSSESSTNDIDVLRADLKQAANGSINSGTKDNTSANIAATMVNETRNTFLLDEEISKSIASYTFNNFEPETDICTALAGTTYNVDDPDISRYQPPLHHNCKSYLSANLKTSSSNPDVTGVPKNLSAVTDSITFKDGE